MSTLTSHELTVGYDREIIIPELTVHLPTGKFTAIVGPNGCGKSTLLKALARLMRPQAGVVCLDAADIREIPSRKLAQRLSILLQTSTAPDALTVRELVSYGRYPHGRWLGTRHPDDADVLKWAMSVTGIDQLSDRPVNSLSGGQQQRAWIAMTLAQGAEVLLLDEPTNHLDMSHQLEIMELLLRLNEQEQKTVVMVLHDLNLAARYAGQMIVMHEGVILVQGSPDEVLTAETLRTAFGVDAQITRDPRSGRPYCVTYPLAGAEMLRQVNR
ncbi:ABC transporter ATP-binding protein [Planctellipticum variicoloris]|uniref:ABC transporter ATP-binding protein n=1 Tax=Planctellipticum variicoloris TaxID=3064265 RepID=UPI003013318D|nr:ABC transporter ATP-binding protein [Planctomycetaceae bacterium SH412]